MGSEATLRMRRVLDNCGTSTCQYGVLADGSMAGNVQRWELGFSNGMSPLQCYQMAVGFGMRVRNLIASNRTGDGEYNFSFPPHLFSMSLVSCCRELSGMGLVFSLKGIDA